MHALRSTVCATALLAFGACGTSSKTPPPPAQPAAPVRPAAPTTPAEYTVIIKSTWTKAKFPLDYPSDAHFSGMIGASHNTRYTIFAVDPAVSRIGRTRWSRPCTSIPLTRSWTS